MSRHIIDRATPTTEGSRMKHFLDLARKEGLHPAIIGMSQRPVGRTARKVEEFLRIDRQERPAV